MRRLLPVLLALVTAALLAALWLQVPGFNGPREWRWDYRPPGLGGIGLAIFAVIAAMAILAALRDGGRFAGSRAGLGLLVLLGCGLTLALVSAQPGGFGRVIGS